MMEVGLVGKPNVGKSTFFSAATLASAEIANYPFTTIEANKGVAYVRAKCPHLDFNVQCNPRNSLCEAGTRLVPVEAIDVAGLVPGAHMGKGLGNKFLDDLRQASALIHIVDASGGTDAEGNPCDVGAHDPVEDVRFLEDEISYWIMGILTKDFSKLAREIDFEGHKMERVFHERFTGLGLSEGKIHAAIRETKLGEKVTQWSEEEILALSRSLQRQGKPIIIAANKVDIAPPENVERLKALEGSTVIPVSAEAELALRRASKSGFVDYTPGDGEFKISDAAKLSKQQLGALERISRILEKWGGTGVQRCIEEAVYRLLGLIVVYPVEDETHLKDKEGRVLPDAHLLPLGSNAKDLAYRVHTDLGNHFIRAVDARTKRVIGHDHELKDGDVIKIVSDA